MADTAVGPFIRIIRRKLGLADARQGPDAALAFVDTGNNIPIDDAGRLTAAEAARLAEFRNERAAAAYRGGRMAAKAALAALRPQALAFEILNGGLGQPLVSAPHADLGVSLSHDDGGAAAIAYPISWPMGVDVARIDRSDLDAVRTQVSTAEEELVRACGVSEPAAAFGLWAAKEAASKVLGGGFGVSFEALAVASAQRAGPLLRLHFRHVAHLQADLLLGPRRAVALAMPYNVTFAWGDAAGSIGD